MAKFNKLLFVFAFIFAIAFWCAVPVSANAPMPADRLSVYISNLSDNAVYADLLIKIDITDENYVDFQPSIYGNDASLVEEIANYSKDGYRSFTLHYKNAKSDIQIKQSDELYYVKFCNGVEYQEYLTQYEDLRNNYGDIKIVLLDKDFNVISVSNSAKLPKDRPTIIFNGNISYDALENNISVDARINPYFILIGGFLSIVIMFMSIGSEIVVALLFGFKGRQILTIFIVNICTQIVMRTLYLVLPVPYLIQTIVFEILVYTFEFLIYKRKFKDMSLWRILPYTIVANSFSLLLGIWLNGFLFA